MSPHDARIRGERAKQLLADDLLTEALARIEADAIDALASVDTSDTLTLQRHAAELQAARAVRDRLTSLVTQGNDSERTPPDVA